MSFERPTAGTGPSAEPAPTPGSPEGTSGEPTPVALQLQVLSTEHWSLLASRSLAWNESFSRAGMFLAALSGAIVALALVAQASAFGEGFRLFALVVLPVVLFLGLTTLLRLGLANYHDALCVVGMNRIRAAYVERVPEVERYLVMSPHDDGPGVWRSMGMDPLYPMPAVMLASAPTVIAVINAVLGGTIAAIASMQVGVSTGVAWAMAGLAAVAIFAGQVWYGRREATRAHPAFAPINPTPSTDVPPTPTGPSV